MGKEISVPYVSIIYMASNTDHQNFHMSQFPIYYMHTSCQIIEGYFVNARHFWPLACRSGPRNSFVVNFRVPFFQILEYFVILFFEVKWLCHFVSLEYSRHIFNILETKAGLEFWEFWEFCEFWEVWEFWELSVLSILSRFSF